MTPDTLLNPETGSLAASEHELHDPCRPARVSHTGKKITLLTLIVALFFVIPSLGAPLTRLGIKDTGYIFPLILSLLVHMWCRYDAAERGRAMNRGLSFGIAVVVIAGFPQYLHDIRGYSYKKAIGITLLWVVTYCIVAFAGIKANVAVLGS